jgi:hypothetical protein
VLLILLYLLISAAAFSQEAGQRILNDGNFRIYYSAENEKTALAVQKLIDFHRPQLEKFYNLKLSVPVNVVIAESRQAFQIYSQNSLPNWAAAVFISPQNLILVKSPSWSGSLPGLEKDFVHEFSHLYFAHKFRGIKMPLWYNEGLAEYLSGAQINMMQAFKISNALFANNIVDLADIESVLGFSQPQAELAYLQALSAVQYLNELLTQGGYDLQSFHEIIVQKGWSAALQECIGTDDIGFEVQWYQSLEKKYRWIMLMDFDNLIWIILVVVLFLALYLIRLRNKRKMRKWEEESDYSPPDSL